MAELKKCMVKKSVTEERVFLLARCAVALHPQSEDHITSGHWVDRSCLAQGTREGQGTSGKRAGLGIN